jgi:hypothetical protein
MNGAHLLEKCHGCHYKREYKSTTPDTSIQDQTTGAHICCPIIGREGDHAYPMPRWQLLDQTIKQLPALLRRQ